MFKMNFLQKSAWLSAEWHIPSLGHLCKRCCIRANLGSQRQISPFFPSQLGPAVYTQRPQNSKNTPSYSI